MLIKKDKSIGNKGQTLVEALVAIGVFLVSINAIIFLLFAAQSIFVDTQRNQEALNYASDGIEAAKSIRDRSWDELTDGEHGLLFSDNQWTFSGTSDSKNNLTRKIVITTQSGDIKDVKSVISWQTNPLNPRTLQTEEILTRWRDILASKSGGDNGGSGLSGNWGSPRTLGSIDLGPGNSATDLDVLNKIVYITAEASAAAKPDFFIVNATNGENPYIVSSINTGPGLNTIDVAGNYAYVENKDINAQLQIIDVSNKNNPVLIKSYKLPGVSGDNAVGQSIFYWDSKVYIGTQKADGPEFHIIDVSNPLNPVALGSYEFDADVNAIYVSGNTAYAATSANAELTILNISNPSNITVLSVYDAPGDSEDGKSLYLVANKLYLGRTVGGNHSNHHEFHILDISSSTSPQNLGSKDLAADLNDLCVRDNLAFLATPDPNKEFQVWDISNPANISLWASFNFPQVATGIDYEDNMIYVSVRSNDALRIITSGQ